MLIIERALSAYERKQKEIEINYTENVKRRVKELENLVEAVFGIPFNEAFDVAKIEVENEGNTLVFDRYLVLHDDEDGLEVCVYEPGFPAALVGKHLFGYIGPTWHEANLIALGNLLAKAQLAAEARRKNAA